MAADIRIFKDNHERNSMCSDRDYSAEHKYDIFGKETDTLLRTCDELFNNSLYLSKKTEKTEQDLLKKIFGIAKRHHVFITWCGNATSVPDPDRFFVSGRGHEMLAFIQC